MTDEKKLTDETLEEVSGGKFRDFSLGGVRNFQNQNCAHCLHQLDCPYGGASQVIQTVGGYATCPNKEEIQP